VSEKTTRLELEYPTAKDTPDGPSQLSALAKRLDLVVPKFYPPTIIAAEQSRESAVYGVLGTADEIKNVVVSKNSLLLVGYEALWSQSKNEKGRAAIFIGENQLRIGSGLSLAPTVAAAYIGSEGARLCTGAGGLTSSSGGFVFASAVDATTGLVMGAFSDEGLARIIEIGGALKVIQKAEAGTHGEPFGGFAVIEKLAAGTYNISVQFKSVTEGKVTAKERRLYAIVLANE
jgi:hypothetical protein